MHVALSNVENESCDCDVVVPHCLCGFPGKKKKAGVAILISQSCPIQESIIDPNYCYVILRAVYPNLLSIMSMSLMYYRYIF